MKKFLKMSFVAVTCLLASTAYAGLPELSNNVFAKGDAMGSLTVGIGGGFSQKLAFDYCIIDGWINNRASLGVGAAVTNDLWWNGNDDLRVTVTCSFHFQFIDKLDTYVISGIGGGCRFYTDGYGTAGLFTYTETIGARWYFTPSFAVNGEVGWDGSSYLMAGITWKF